MNARRGIAGTLATIAVVVALGLTTATPVRAQSFSVMAGLNFSDQDDIETGSANATFENSTGYHVGLSFELGAGALSLRPGVLYQRLGTFDFDLPSGEELDLSAVEVPIDVMLTVLPAPVFSPYLVAGPVLTFPQGEGDLGDGVESLSLTADVGAGAEIDLPGVGLRLLPEVRYSVGVTDYLSESFDVAGTTIEPQEDQRSSGKIMVRLHVGF